ncbi:hypothetical protein HAX54_019216, partial [Datura stramonium]|nr:hypothetical protein [Datura stramonium]
KGPYTRGHWLIPPTGAKEGLFRLRAFVRRKGSRTKGWKESFYLISGGLVRICSGGGGQ